MKVVAFFRPFNRDPQRRRVCDVSFEAPRAASLLDLVELAHDAGASPAIRTACGVFELQTDDGIWSCPDESRLLTSANTKASPKARFQSWDELDAAADREERIMVEGLS